MSQPPAAAANAGAGAGAAQQAQPCRVASEVNKFDNALAIPCERNKRYVVDLGPDAVPFWQELVRKVNDGNLALGTLVVQAPDGRVQVHLDVRNVSADSLLDGSASEQFVTPDGQPLDIRVRYAGAFALLPPSWYTTPGGELAVYEQLSQTVSILSDARMIEALLDGLKACLRPPAEAEGDDGGGGLAAPNPRGAGTRSVPEDIARAAEAAEGEPCGSEGKQASTPRAAAREAAALLGQGPRAEVVIVSCW